LSGSAFVLGMVGFASQAPILLFGAFGGVVTDRLDRRRVLLATQALSMVQALLLAALAWKDAATPGHLVGLAFVLGCINALDVPARQAIAVQLVDDPDDLPNAIALNSFLMNTARFVGPALAGFVVAEVGEAVCFLLNAASYLAVLMALRAIRLPAAGDRPPAPPPLQALREGWRYAMAHREIRASLRLVAAISLCAAPYVVLMPLFAREEFGGGARLFGLLVGSAGAGSLVASFYLAGRADTGGLAEKVAVAAPTVGVAVILFALSPGVGMAVPVLLALGGSIILTIAGSNTLIQTQVDNAFRGRVMALFSMAFLGVAPLGSFTVGSAAHVFGVRPTLVVCGVLTVIAGLIYRRAVLRRKAAAAA
ncbi:MAG TPA: MFS transporter, partial [Rhodocyclaceae bacterium]|nr:MFS transporter [Rhodocyclaceae bacterium]